MSTCVFQRTGRSRIAIRPAPCRAIFGIFRLRISFTTLADRIFAFSERYASGQRRIQMQTERGKNRTRSERMRLRSPDDRNSHRRSTESPIGQTRSSTVNEIRATPIRRAGHSRSIHTDTAKSTRNDPARPARDAIEISNKHDFPTWDGDHDSVRLPNKACGRNAGRYHRRNDYKHARRSRLVRRLHESRFIVGDRPRRKCARPRSVDAADDTATRSAAIRSQTLTHSNGHPMGDHRHRDCR